MNIDDRALGYVLETLEDEDMDEARKQHERDPAFAEAVARAERDIATIQRGVGLVARDATAAVTTATRRWVRYAGAAAAAALVVAGAVAIAARGPSATPDELGPGPQLGAGVPGLGELDTLVDSSVAVVAGRVTAVKTGSADDEGGLGYTIWTVEVDEVLAGEVGARVHAFDYAYGGSVTSIDSSGGADPQVGDAVLVFLSDSTGTVHADIEPTPHYQVTHGAAGRYLIVDGELAGAAFSLDEVRRATA